MCDNWNKNGGHLKDACQVTRGDQAASCVSLGMKTK